MSELLAHLVGDYVVQTDHQAARKTQAHGPALAHAATYTACFLPLTRRWQPLLVIGASHFVIDRWRLARHLVWAKNQAAPAAWRHPWDEHVRGSGYHRESNNLEVYAREAGMHDGWDPRCQQQAKPAWMGVWLMIVADNSLHGLANRWALKRWS